MGAPDQHRSPTGALSKSCGGRWSLRPPCPLPLPPIFFSSRRRHMRCSRDWSSDVCSSDLRLVDGDAVRRLPALAELVQADEQDGVLDRIEEPRFAVGERGELGVELQACAPYALDQGAEILDRKSVV